MRRNWLTKVEREYVRSLLDEAIQHVKLRDRKACAKFVQHAIRTRRMSTAFLSQDVINTFANKGFGIINGMLKRHAGYANLPLPLQAKALHNKAAAVGLVQRTNKVRVDASTLREECSYAETRHKMNMSDEVGRQAKHVLMVKTKRKQCVQAIQAQANATGVADITRVWRDFQSSTKAMEEVSLEAIAAVARLKHVYVLDIHGMTCLFYLPTFQKMFKLLEHSHIFAINMGEDAGRFDEPHFVLLASKIFDGSSAVRRWFVESNPTRRAVLVKCGLVKDNANPDKLNVFTIARRKDREKWNEGERDLTRLSWLLAPESAFTAATDHNTNMQNSLCNWTFACAARRVVPGEPRLLQLATIAAHTQTQNRDMGVQNNSN
jgi:hypothetical protein